MQSSVICNCETAIAIWSVVLYWTNRDDCCVWSWLKLSSLTKVVYSKQGHVSNGQIIEAALEVVSEQKSELKTEDIFVRH